MTSPRIAIVNYETCNLFSVENACKRANLAPQITSSWRDLRQYDGIILPGVGSFPEALSNLQRLDLIAPLQNLASQGMPFLCVCLGMQLLFEYSEEFGRHTGLGIIPGHVSRIPDGTEGNSRKIPHMGWSPLHICQPDNPLYEGIPNNTDMYFVHSYYVAPTNQSSILTKTTYDGFSFCSSICVGNIHAVQFHPEKSARWGLKLYTNWAQTL